MPPPPWGTQACADEVTFTIHSKTVATELRPDLTSALLAYYRGHHLIFLVSKSATSKNE